MNKQVIIAVILAGVVAIIFTPMILLDRDQEEGTQAVAEKQEAAAPADAGPEAAAESDGAGPAPEAETAGDAAPAAPESEPESAAAAESPPAETEAAATASEPAPSAAQQAEAPAADSPEAEPETETDTGGEVAAQIRIADAPVITDEQAAESAGEPAARTVAEAPEPVAALEQGSAEDPSVGAEGEAAEAAPAPGQDIKVVPRAETAPQVAALPDQPEAIDLPPTRAPSFDVVRVEPTGEAVIAGRAEPGSRVTLTDDGEEIASVQADGAGDWVIILDEPLGGGSHQLGLLAETPGGDILESENVVIVAVPEAPEAVAGRQAETEAESESAAIDEPAGEALAVLAPREGEGPSVVLQQPDAIGITDRELVLNAIDYDAQGRVIVSGKAPAGARVVVYLDDRAIGQVEADENGVWVLRPNTVVTVGLHRLRLDQLDAGGKVVARIESPFSRAQALLDIPGERFVVVQPGNSLWFIARQTYGEGLRYTLIFDSNAGQIRDPDLIYPGQIFLIPELN